MYLEISHTGSITLKSGEKCFIKNSSLLYFVQSDHGRFSNFTSPKYFGILRNSSQKQTCTNFLSIL